MSISNIKSIILRDLDALSTAIGQYPHSQMLWEVLPGTSNSAGNLALHLIGNLRHFVGAIIGKTGYIRNREDEFNLKNLDKETIQNLINTCKSEVETAFDKMDPADLDKEFAVEVSSKKSQTGYVMLHLISHFNYHLGQINYHRRVLTSFPAEL